MNNERKLLLRRIDYFKPDRISNIRVLVGGLVVLMIYIALAVFQSYHDLEAVDSQSLKFKWWGGESNPGPLTPQAKSLTTRPPPLPSFEMYIKLFILHTFIWYINVYRTFLKHRFECMLLFYPGLPKSFLLIKSQHLKLSHSKEQNTFLKILSSMLYHVNKFKWEQNTSIQNT